MVGPTIGRRISDPFAATILLALLGAGVSTVVQAEVRVEGTLAAVRITTNHNTIPDVLGALEAAFNVRYRTSVALDRTTSGTYLGSFGQVISRLLDGYNYVIVYHQYTVELIVLGVRGEPSIPVQNPNLWTDPVQQAGG
jgi:hypothetical protein